MYRTCCLDAVGYIGVARGLNKLGQNFKKCDEKSIRNRSLNLKQPTNFESGKTVGIVG